MMKTTNFQHAKNRRFFGMKKAQIHMMETISVLAVFFILVILGFIFYSNVLRSNFELEKEENIQLESIKIVQKVSSLPELQCSQDNVVRDNCIDIFNLEALSEVIDQNEIHYFDMFSFSKITVREVYPGNNEWLLYDRNLEDYSQKIVTNVPITVFDPIEKRNSFGVMKVEFFVK